MKLSVVIPVFNELNTIRDILERVRAVPIDKEIIVVDDEATDGSRDIVARLAEQWSELRHVIQPANMGKGAAIRQGIDLARGDLILIQDADLEYEITDYPALLAAVNQGADVVYGSRFHSSQPHRVLYFWHSVGNRFLTTASNMFTNLNLTDMETCYKAFRAEVIKGIRVEEDRFGFEPEVTAKVARGGWRVYEVPISYAGRTYEEGKKIGWKDGLSAIWHILRFNLLAPSVPAYRPPTSSPAHAPGAPALLAAAGGAHAEREPQRAA